MIKMKQNLISFSVNYKQDGFLGKRKMDAEIAWRLRASFSRLSTNILVSLKITFTTGALYIIFSLNAEIDRV